MPRKSSSSLPPDEPQWYCIHTKAKSEHLAVTHLTHLCAEPAELELFNPRIRYQKPTNRGKVWFTESLFPGYIFGRFILGDWLRAVNHTAAVLRVVSFGGRHVPIPEDLIDLWRQQLNDQELITISEVLEPGDEVEIVEGPLRGLQTVITEVVPAHERVNILLEILGDEREVELAVDSIRKMGGNIRSTDTMASSPRDHHD
ncbi:MAG: transcription termination/antitermination NusG family protein [Verrucomicrobiota bacterium]